MRRFRFAGFVWIFLMAACTDKDKIPSDVLPREKMEKVMWDMMQADQYAGIYLAKDTVVVRDSVAFRKDSAAAAKQLEQVRDSAKLRLKVETLKLYAEVFTLNKTTREEFDRSYTFYQSRPDLTRSMFDSLIAKGNRLRTENYNRPPSSPGASGPPNSVPTQASPLIQPTSTNAIKTTVPGGLIHTKPVGNRPPMLQHAPGYVPGMPGGAQVPVMAPGQRAVQKAPFAAPGQGPVVAPGSKMPAPSETRPLTKGLLRNKGADTVIKKGKQ